MERDNLGLLVQPTQLQIPSFTQELEYSLLVWTGLGESPGVVQAQFVVFQKKGEKNTVHLLRRTALSMTYD